MSTDDQLPQLLYHPQVEALASSWREALSAGRGDELWAQWPMTQAQERVEPLSAPLEWAALCEPGGGKTLGLLIGRDSQGGERLLRAFSGQLQGAWLREGWAPPLFEPSAIARASWETQTQLHLINRHLSEGRGDPQELKRARKRLSQALTQQLLEAYTLQRLRAGALERCSLAELWPSAPLGTGDCCAPKLLCWAASLGLQVIGLTELWWGPPQAGRSLGQTMAPCQERCGPLLPWLLGDK